MKQISAGLLMCRWFKGEIQFFLTHPGGPFFAKKHFGAWSIPKGIPDEGENLLSAAIREFFEETSITPSEPFFPLTPIRQKAGKVVHAWAFFGNWNENDGITSNFFNLEWPPKSGRMQKIPEVDKAEWMTLTNGLECINPGQRELLNEASEKFAMKKQTHLPA